MKKEILCLIGLLMTACGHSGVRTQQGRILVDNSMKGEELPEWTNTSKTSWDDGNQILFKSTFTIPGNQRVNGCYDLARIELSEKILSEIESDIKGELNLANEGLFEGDGPMLTKTILTRISGKVRGLGLKEQAYERYLVANTERIDCHILSAMSRRDYQKLKDLALKQWVSVSNEVAQAVRDRQKRLLDDGNNEAISQNANE